jgi:hypothetical protein
MKINQNNRYGLLKRETLTRVMTIIDSTKAVLRIRNVFTRICTDLTFHFDADPEDTSATVPVRESLNARYSLEICAYAFLSTHEKHF